MGMFLSLPYHTGRVLPSKLFHYCATRFHYDPVRQVYNQRGSIPFAPLIFFAFKLVHGFCCLQNSCLLFRKLIASLAYSDTPSVLVSALRRSGCLIRFSRYSLSMYRSPSSRREARFSSSSRDSWLRLAVLGFSTLVGFFCGWFFVLFPIVFSIASCVF